MRKIFSVFLALALAVSPAFAGGTLSLMGIGPAGNEPPLDISFTDQAASGTAADGTSFSFSNRAIGAADANRIIIFAIVRYFTAANPTSVTIGGISATQMYCAAGGSQNANVCFYYANVPTGTTATISFNTATSRGAAVAIWRALHLKSTTPVDQEFSAGTSATLNMSTENGGAILVASVKQLVSSGTTSFTYGNVTSNGSAIMATVGGFRTTAASADNLATDGSPVTVTVTYSGATTYSAGSGAISIR